MLTVCFAAQTSSASITAKLGAVRAVFVIRIGSTVLVIGASDVARSFAYGLSSSACCFRSS